MLFCLANGRELPDLTLEELSQFSDMIEKDVYKVLEIEGSVNSRVTVGGTGLIRVEEALISAEKQLGIS